MNLLQRSLLINAIFSGVSGITLVVLNRQIADLFQVTDASAFWITGLCLIGFSGMVAYEIKRQKRSGVWAIISQDLLWVFGSLILLVVQPFGISLAGNITIALVALVVLAMAINQGRALGQLEKSGNTD